MRQVVARHCVTFPTKRLKNILNSEFHILLKFSPLGLARIFYAILHSWCYRIFFALLKETRTGCIWYIRYMDDFVVLAKTRHQFSKAIKQVHAVMRQLKLTLHKEQKCFIGKTQTGFDFLGYQVCPHQRLHPSVESIRRLTNRYRRLYEQGVSLERLRQYVVRWCC